MLTPDTKGFFTVPGTLLLSASSRVHTNLLASGQPLRRAVVPPLHQAKLQSRRLRHRISRCWRRKEVGDLHPSSRLSHHLTLPRVASIADQLDVGFALIHKERPRPNVVGRMVGDAASRHVSWL